MIDNDMLQFALALLVTTSIVRLCVRDHFAEWSICIAAFMAVRCTACDAPVLRVAATRMNRLGNIVPHHFRFRGCITISYLKLMVFLKVCDNFVSENMFTTNFEIEEDRLTVS